MSDAQAVGAESPRTEISLDALIGLEISLERTNEGKRKKALKQSEKLFVLNHYLALLDQNGVPYHVYLDQDERIFVLGNPKKLEETFKLFVPTIQEGIQAETLNLIGASTFESYVAARMHVAETEIGKIPALQREKQELAGRLSRAEQEIIKSGNMYRDLLLRSEALTVEMGKVQSLYATQTAKVGQLESELAASSSEVASAKQVLARVNDLEGLLTQANIEKSASESAAEVLKQTNKELQSELSSLQTQLETAKSQSQSPAEKEELIALRAKVEVLQSVMTTAITNGSQTNGQPKDATPKIEIIPGEEKKVEPSKEYAAILVTARSVGHWLYTTMEHTHYGNVRHFLRANGKTDAGEIYRIARRGFSDEAQLKKISFLWIANGVTYAKPDFLDQLQRQFLRESTIIELSMEEKRLAWPDLLNHRINRLGFLGTTDFCEETRIYTKGNLYQLVCGGCKRDGIYQKLSESLFLSVDDLKKRAIKK